MNDSTKIKYLPKRALFALFIGAAAIALSPIFVRLSELGPSATAFYRIFFALPVLWLWMYRTDSDTIEYRQPSSLKDYFRLSLAGLFFAGDLSFWHWSINLTSIANSTLLANAAPIFVTLGAFFLFGEKFSKLFIFGLLLALSGILLLMSNSLDLGQHGVIGDLLGVVTAVFYAAYLLTVGRLRAQFSTATVMTWSGTACCIILIPVTILSGESFIAGSLAGWIILLSLALFSHAGGQSLITYSLAHLPAAFGSVGLLLQPVLAAFIAWFVFSEILGGLQLFGGSIVLVGIYLARRGS